MKALTLFLVSSLMVVSEADAAYSDYSTSTPNTNSTNSEDVYSRVRAALENDPILTKNGNNIQVSIDSSNRVTLTGTVSQASDKRRAETLVRGMRGVKTVNNNITYSR